MYRTGNRKTSDASSHGRRSKNPRAKKKSTHFEQLRSSSSPSWKGSCRQRTTVGGEISRCHGRDASISHRRSAVSSCMRRLSSTSIDTHPTSTATTTDSSTGYATAPTPRSLGQAIPSGTSDTSGGLHETALFLPVACLLPRQSMLGSYDNTMILSTGGATNATAVMRWRRIIGVGSGPCRTGRPMACRRWRHKVSTRSFPEAARYPLSLLSLSLLPLSLPPLSPPPLSTHPLSIPLSILGDFKQSLSGCGW
ncbi:hypothetical protein F4780DRAFT_101189 [Xylariomycetidae sp. FL0641]|nr:hypothetical protein F4780DRAFT_101189 [Xylariomycetidae sp. FL0641]